MELIFDIIKKGEGINMKKSIVCVIVIMVIFGVGVMSVYGQETYRKFLTLPFKKQNPTLMNGWYYKSPISPHRGIDWQLVYEEVVAAADGVVEDILDNQPNTYPAGEYCWGNFVKIDHDNGFKTIYGHLKTGEIKVLKGQSVVAGQLIATSGNTGYSSTEHLHFEVWGPKTGGEPAKTVDEFNKYDPYGLYLDTGDVTPYKDNEMNEAKQLWTSNPPVHGTGLPLTITSFWSSTEEYPPGPWVKGLGDNFKITYKAKNNSEEDITVKGFRLEVHDVETGKTKVFVEDLEETILVADKKSDDNTHKIDEVNISVSTLVSEFGTDKTLRVVATAEFDPPDGEKEKPLDLDWYEIGSRSLELPEFSVQLFTHNRKDSDKIWWFGRDDTMGVSFVIQNNGPGPVTFDKLLLALHDAKDNYLETFKKLGTSTDKIELNVELKPGYQNRHTFYKAELNLENYGIDDYLIVAKYKQGDKWHNVATQHSKIPPLTSKFKSFYGPGPWILFPANQELRIQYEVLNNSDTDSALIKDREIVLRKMDGTEVCEDCEFMAPGADEKYTEGDEIILEPGEKRTFPREDLNPYVTLDLNSITPDVYRVSARAYHNGTMKNIGSTLLTMTHFEAYFRDVGHGLGPWTVKEGSKLEISFKIKNTTNVPVEVKKLTLDIVDYRGIRLDPIEQNFNTKVDDTLIFEAVSVNTADAPLEPSTYKAIASMTYGKGGNDVSEKMELISQEFTVIEDPTYSEPIPVESRPYETDGTIRPKEIHFWKLFVDAAETYFKAMVTYLGSDLDLIIITPSGKTLYKDSPEVLDFHEGPTDEYYVVRAAEPGDWMIGVFADDVPAEGENYTFTITETLGLPVFPSSNFHSLQAAINHAYSKNGGIVLVEPGIYRENIGLKNNVYLIAASSNPADTVIQGVKENRDVVKIDAKNCAIVGFTIKVKKKEKGKGKGSQGNAAGINVIGGSKNPLIANCIILDNQHGIIVQGNSLPLILNNTIVQNAQTGIITNGNAPAVVLNNIIVENGIGVHAQSKKAIKTLNYNDVWGNSTNYKGIKAGANSIKANPAFKGFFQIKANSPCKNAGKNYVNSKPINIGAYVELDWQQIYRIYKEK